MAAKKIAISITEEALEAVDRYAEVEGISRSAWFERAARRARRREAMAQALRELTEDGRDRASTDRELERLRRELAEAG